MSFLWQEVIETFRIMVDLSNMKQMYILCGYESFAFKLLAALVLFVKVRSNNNHAPVCKTTRIGYEEIYFVCT